MSKLSIATGLIVGILLGMLTVSSHPRSTVLPAAGAQSGSNDLDQLSPDEIRALVLRALSKLGEQEDLTSGDSNPDRDLRDAGARHRQEIQEGIDNMRRLLPQAKQWAVDSLREAVGSNGLEPSEWAKVIRLIYGVRKIVPCRSLPGAAAVQDDRPSEILVDSGYAPYLASGDVATFLLGHELMHVAARSGKLNLFIDVVASDAKRLARVAPTARQKEDLACDFLGELVLRRFISQDAAGESPVIRVLKVFGYEPPAQRLARAWEDFCASYNGTPADDSHLTQYETMRALYVLDPELRDMMLESGRSISSWPHCKSGDKNY